MKFPNPPSQLNISRMHFSWDETEENEDEAGG